MKKRLVLSYVSIFCLSLLLFLATCWVANWGFCLAACVESVAFFFWTYFCYGKCSKYDGMKQIIVTFLIIIARVVLEIPLRIYDVNGTMISITVPLFCVLGIILGGLCYRWKSKTLIIVSCVFLALCSVLITNIWVEHVLNTTSF